jgi:hypothetical protein
MAQSPPPSNCPTCQSPRIARVIYGLPIFDDQLQRDLVTGKVVLGGVPNQTNNPDWLCLNCDADHDTIKIRPTRQKRSQQLG